MSRMKLLSLVLASATCSLAAAPVQAAESLRCTGGIASEGDSRLSVAYKCGQPLLKDNYCAQVVYSGTWQPVPEPFASVYVPCQPIEEWLYDRGPGNLMATVKFRSGVVQSIVHGRQPR
jgi:hypothetical protein